jgi:predicted nucleic acid-binding protein
MRVVVDTNVIAYFLLGTAGFQAEVSRFWRRVRDPIAPALWEAELANVVRMAVRSGVLGPDDAPKRLTLAAGFGIRSASMQSLWHGALARATSSGVAVYDTLFVELAVQEHVKLATYDARILKSFPDVGRRPGELMA